MNRKTKLEKALAFDDTRLQTSNEVVARGKLNPPNANARLAPLHAALIEAVEALEYLEDDSQFGEYVEEALAKLDKALEGMG